MRYNFIRIHQTLRVTPAMSAGLTERLWGTEDIVALIDTHAEAPKPRPLQILPAKVAISN